MISITSKLYAYLAAQSSITSICPVAGIMAAPADLSAASLPVLTFQEQNREADILLTGQPSGLVQGSLIFQCAGKSPEIALNLADAVDAIFNGLSGAAIGSIHCVLCYNRGRSDNFDEDTQAHVVTLNYQIAYR